MFWFHKAKVLDKLLDSCLGIVIGVEGVVEEGLEIFQCDANCLDIVEE